MQRPVVQVSQWAFFFFLVFGLRESESPHYRVFSKNFFAPRFRWMVNGVQGYWSRVGLELIYYYLSIAPRIENRT